MRRPSCVDWSDTISNWFKPQNNCISYSIKSWRRQTSPVSWWCCLIQSPHTGRGEGPFAWVKLWFRSTSKSGVSVALDGSLQTHWVNEAAYKTHSTPNPSRETDTLKASLKMLSICLFKDDKSYKSPNYRKQSFQMKYLGATDHSKTSGPPLPPGTEQFERHMLNCKWPFKVILPVALSILVACKNQHTTTMVLISHLRWLQRCSCMKLPASTPLEKTNTALYLCHVEEQWCDISSSAVWINWITTRLRPIVCGDDHFYLWCYFWVILVTDSVCLFFSLASLELTDLSWSVFVDSARNQQNPISSLTWGSTSGPCIHSGPTEKTVIVTLSAEYFLLFKDFMSKVNTFGNIRKQNLLPRQRRIEHH